MLRRLFRWLIYGELKPGLCECSHYRCAHIIGFKQCTAAVDGASCACEVYIPKNSNVDEELDQLRKMSGVK